MSAVLAPCLARAQTPDLTTRRVLIEQAQSASQAGDHRLALQRAEQAMAIQSTPSLRLFYARTLVANARPADAFAQAEACVREVERDASVPNRDALLQGCRTIAQETRGELGMLIIRVSGERPQGLRVTIGGRPLPDGLLGVASAVNPGDLVVEASAEGYRPLRREVTVTRGGQAELELTMERDPHAVVGRGAPARGGGDERVAPAPVEQYRTRPVSIPAVIVASAGGVLVASAGVFFALRQGAIAPCEIRAGVGFSCPNGDERDALASRASQVETMNTLTNVALIGGAIVLAGGVAWVVADRATSRERVSGARRAPSMYAFSDGRSASVLVGGVW
jgi:hypothetical protein